MARFVGNSVVCRRIVLALLLVAPSHASSLATERFVAGQVVGDQKQPLADADVGLQIWKFGQDRPDPDAPFVATTKTDSEGRFRLAVPSEIEPRKVLAVVWAIAADHMPIRSNSYGTLSGLLGQEGVTIRLTPASGVALRVLGVDGEPAEGVRVSVARQRLPQSVAYQTPADWQTRLQGKTDNAGLARLPHVVPDAVAEVTLYPSDRPVGVQLNQNFFLNERPVAAEPHFTWKLPETGSVSGRLAVEAGELPPDLMITLRTESELPDSGSRARAWGTATVAVDAEGRFATDGLAVGPLVIPPFLDDDQPLRAEIPDRVAVLAGQTTELKIPIRRGVLVRGLIRKSDSQGGYPGFSLSVIYGQSAREHRDMRQKFELETDAEGRFSAYVPPGPIELRLHSAPVDYRDVTWWGDRAGHWGERHEVPADVESFDLDPIELVPAQAVEGQLVDADEKPLAGWMVFGYPDIPNLPRDKFRMNSVAGVHTDQSGRFSESHPSTFPPAFWQASNRNWPTPYEFDDDKWEVKVLRESPLVLQVEFSQKKKDTPPDAADREPDKEEQELKSDSVEAAEPALSIDPTVLVAASVLDAETSQPLKSFRVLPGTPFTRVTGPDDLSPAVWQPHMLREATDGQFQWPTAKSYRQFRLRFEADGYIPEVSPWINKDDGARAITIRMRRDPGIVGRVLLTDGQVAAGAVLAITMPNRGVRLLDSGEFAGADDPLPEKLTARWRRPIFVTADDQGRYRLPTEPGAVMVYASHDGGIAEVTYAALEQSTDIHLAAWGSIDGRVLWIDRPGANEKLHLSVMREAGGYPEVCSLYRSLQSDAEGRFHADRLPPWQVQLSRSFESVDGQGSYLFPHLHVPIVSGPPTEVIFGGKGRPVIGKLVGLDSYEGITLAITPNTPRPGDQSANIAHFLFRQSDIGPVFFRDQLPINPDGSFRIENVIPEYYQLFVRSLDKRVHHVQQLLLTPPPTGQPNEPHDVGEIKVTRRAAE